MANERKRYAEAYWQSRSRLVDYVNSGKDPAYGFQAYLCWREAVPLKDAAINAVYNEAVQLSSSDGNEPNEPELVRMRLHMNRDFAELQEAVFRVLDEIALEGVNPTAHGRAKASRFHVAYTVSNEMWRRREVGGTQTDIYGAVAPALGESTANVRKLNDGFLEAAGLTVASICEFDALKKRLADQRIRAKLRGKESQSRSGPHRWKGPKK